MDVLSQVTLLLGFKASKRPRSEVMIDLIRKETGWPEPQRTERGQFFARFLTLRNVQVYEPIKTSAKKRREFYQTQAWKSLRYSALKKYGARCQCCGRSAHDGVVIHVDHIKPRATHPHLSLKIENLQILCEDCNLGKSAWDDTDWRHDADQHLKDIMLN